MPPEYVTLLVSYAALAIGAGLVVYCLVLLLSWRRARYWPAVPGELVDAHLRKGVRRTKSAPLDLYIPKVEYRYRFGDQEYTGKRITVRDRHLASVDEQEARNVIERLDQHPEVYVDPARPGRSVLDNRLGWPHFDFLLTYTIIGLLLSGAGIAILAVR